MSIGIGGVMAEVAWIRSEYPVVTKSMLVKNLCERFNTDIDSVNDSIEMAKLCGVIDFINDEVILRSRNESI